MSCADVTHDWEIVSYAPIAFYVGAPPAGVKRCRSCGVRADHYEPESGGGKFFAGLPEHLAPR